MQRFNYLLQSGAKVLRTHRCMNYFKIPFASHVNKILGGWSLLEQNIIHENPVIKIVNSRW